MPREGHGKNSDAKTGERVGGPWPNHRAGIRQSWGSRPGLLPPTPSLEPGVSCLT